ncbi:MAG: hypothetical protein AB1781_02465 [Pseudomonadota bacterium]
MATVANLSLNHETANGKTVTKEYVEYNDVSFRTVEELLETLENLGREFDSFLNTFEAEKKQSLSFATHPIVRDEFDRKCELARQLTQKLVYSRIS